MLMLEGAAILLVGVIIGRFLPSRRPAYRGGDAKPICGCKHDRSYHDPETGLCHGRVWEDGSPVGCTCRQYGGPEPLPTYTAEISS